MGVSRGLLRVRVRVRRSGEKPDSVRQKLPKRVKRQAPPRYYHQRDKSTARHRGKIVVLAFQAPGLLQNVTERTADVVLDPEKIVTQSLSGYRPP
ncbi:hypothetical protein K456DRAFT_929378 [Colletotrichum gloeosporioides 23]|nr:hypothetical protein K456DRAFT_929378 [Colletotrichum gloeosporioides 23]